MLTFTYASPFFMRLSKADNDVFQVFLFLSANQEILQKMKLQSLVRLLRLVIMTCFPLMNIYRSCSPISRYMSLHNLVVFHQRLN